MIGNKLEELTPDWQQIYLNGGPPCFAVMEEDLRFCNRAERWEGHPSDHKFVSWTDFLFEVMMWGQNAHASHTAAIREKAEALVAVNPVSVYRDKIVEYICEDDFDFTKILEEVEYEGEKYCDISQDGAFALVDYFLNLMEMVNEWRSEDAGQNYDFLHGKAELEKGNG